VLKEGNRGGVGVRPGDQADTESDHSETAR
jgi:hypothetical protein